MTQAEKIARRFSELLWDNVTHEDMHRVIRLNDAETDLNIDHIHDVCDANHYMDIAMREFRLDSLKDIDMTNNAWNIAKQSKFSVA